MSLRFFADHCITNYIIQKLEESEIIVLRLRDYIPKANGLDLILISLNGYFADIVTYTPQNYKGIISL